MPKRLRCQQESDESDTKQENDICCPINKQATTNAKVATSESLDEKDTEVKDTEVKEVEETDKIVKRLFFQFNAGYYQVNIGDHSEFCNALEKIHTTIACMRQVVQYECKYHGETINNDEEGECSFHFPFHVSKQDIMVFLTMSSVIVSSDDWSAIPLATLNVDFVKVKQMWDFLGMPTDRWEMLLHFLKKSENGNLFHSPLTAFSAFQLTKRKQRGITLAHLTHLQDCAPLDSFLEFAVTHDLGNEFLNPHMIVHKKIAETLEMEEDLLKFLHPKKCVMAGGACTKIGCEKSKFDYCNDIDFFVLSGPDQSVITNNLCQAIKKTGRVIYRKGGSVFTAIGHWNRRRIQVIASSHANGQDVVKEFDFPACRSFYDGFMLHATCAAQYDWLKMKCSITMHCSLRASRVLGMYWKGFEINEETQKFMKHTHIGWPPSKERLIYYETGYPFLTPDIPRDRQDQILWCMHKLKPTYEETDLVLDQFSRSKYWQEDNHYSGPPNEYSKECVVDKVAIPLRKYKPDVATQIVLINTSLSYGVGLTKLKRIEKEEFNNKYEISLSPDLTICFMEELPAELSKDHPVLKDLTYVNNMKSGHPLFLGRAAFCKFYDHGIKLPDSFDLANGEYMCLLYIRPMWFHIRDKHFTIRWGVSTVFLNS